MQVSITLCNPPSFAFHSVYRETLWRQVHESGISKHLMHSRQNYKQKQFENGENEASHEKFMASVVKWSWLENAYSGKQKIQSVEEHKMGKRRA